MVEGRISFDGFDTRCRIVEARANPAPRKLPVLALHGGPGLPHDSLEPLADLARTGRPVVFYDQLGCGGSARTRDPDPWSVDLFLRELAMVRRELGLDAVHLVGHSWGGLLAMEHALEADKRPASLILIGAVAVGRMVSSSAGNASTRSCRRMHGRPSASTSRRELSMTPSTRTPWASSTGATPAASTRGPTG